MTRTKTDALSHSGRRWSLFAALTLAATIAAFPALAQKKQLTLETLYNPSQKVNFSGTVQSGFQWLDESTVVWPKRDAKGDPVGWMKLDTKTGKETPLFDRDRLARALREAGLSESEAKAAAQASGLSFDEKKNAALIETAGDLFLFNIAGGKVTRLTSAPGREEVAAFSPDGTRVGFVRDNNLFVVDVATQRERQLTTDGNKQLLNGILDWVYEEEIYGRGQRTAFWWSPDSSRIAYLQLDEAPVHEFTVVDHIPYRGTLETYDYPKAGDPNPTVKLLTISASGGEPAAVDNERYSGADFLIVNVAWNRDGSALTYQVQNREQTWLELNTVAPSGGSGRVLLRETTPAWVNENGNPKWLADDSFLWMSERDGYRHVYHYKADGTLVRQVTRGEWEVRDLHGIDEKSGTIYFSGTERSPIGSDVYRVSLDGSGLKRLSDTPGTHSVKFSPAFSRYIDNWSDVNTPNQIRLHRNDGSVERVIEQNKAPLVAEYDIPRPEFLQVKTRDGFTMEAMMIKPANFDPSKKYPVFQYLYAGPHAQTVVNGWRGAGTLFNQLIANQGVIVWMCDNRTASGKGAVSTWPVYKHFGETELRDIEDGIAWLKTQPYVDGSRIMLSGWSYGGFMTSYALTHSKTFIAGVAGGTVADWRDYDSIYTERYMMLPQNNAEGYKNSSPRWAAKDLHGNLLLIHGTIDDNVHMQNTLQFVYELEKAGKPFDMRLYPKSRHGVREPLLVYDLQRTILEFVRKNLLP
jgi:dipeptidyl-peptidase-4